MSEQENEETKRNCLLGWVTKTTDDGWGVGPYICVCVYAWTNMLYMRRQTSESLHENPCDNPPSPLSL